MSTFSGYTFGGLFSAFPGLVPEPPPLGAPVAESRVMVIYRGLVQGVGFRWTVCEIASALGVRGVAENLSDGSVRLWAEGRPETLEHLLQQIRVSSVGSGIEQEAVTWLATATIVE